MHTLYGIKNCDTIKKARKWLEINEIAYQFHDYRRNGLDINLLQKFETQLGWEVLVNKRSTSWRQLGDAQKTNLSRDNVLPLLLQHPTLIKRPILVTTNKTIIGFSATQYQNELIL
jgi:Spx/MgsR family transcriptional regulator